MAATQHNDEVYHMYPYVMYSLFNSGNLKAVQQMVNGYIDESCQVILDFRHMSQPRSYQGRQWVFKFYDAMYDGNPDAVLLSKRMDSYEADGYLTVRSKLYFSGTCVSTRQTEKIYSPSYGQLHKMLDLKGLKPEEIVELERKEREILARGNLVLRFGKGVLEMIIDR